MDKLVIEKDIDLTFDDISGVKELKFDIKDYISEGLLSSSFDAVNTDDDVLRKFFYDSIKGRVKEGSLEFKQTPLVYDEPSDSVIEAPTFGVKSTDPTITKKYIPVNKYSRPGTKRTKTTKIAWHYTGGANVPAINTWNYFNSLRVGVKYNGKYTYASSQYIVGLKGEIYQLMPDNEVAYTTNQANSYSVGIECSHLNVAGEYSKEEYRSMVWLGVMLAKKYGLNPKNDFIRHYDVTGKLCPMWFVKHVDAWNKFKQDCYDVLHGKGLDDVVGAITITEPANVLVNGKDYNFAVVCEVNVSENLNVRATKPIDGTLGEKLFSIPSGGKMKIGYVSDDWAYIDYNGKNGYVSIKYIKVVSQKLENKRSYDFKTICKVVNTFDKNLNVRDSRPVDGVLGNKIFVLAPNTEVSVGYVLNDWAYISINGKYGYVSIEYLQVVI